AGVGRGGHRAHRRSRTEGDDGDRRAPEGGRVLLAAHRPPRARRLREGGRVIAAATAAGLGATVGALAYGAYHPNSALFGPVIAHGPRDARTIYLTFDDGPNATATAGILETLER